MGGELAVNLSDLYSYMIQRLLVANMKNDPTILDEVSGLLLELRGAWESIRQAEPRPQAVTPPHQPVEKTTLVYGRM